MIDDRHAFIPGGGDRARASHEWAIWPPDVLDRAPYDAGRGKAGASKGVVTIAASDGSPPTIVTRP